MEGKKKLLLSRYESCEQMSTYHPHAFLLAGVYFLCPNFVFQKKTLRVYRFFMVFAVKCDQILQFGAWDRQLRKLNQ